MWRPGKIFDSLLKIDRKMNCPHCSSAVLAHVERCHVCGEDVGFPNVRAAQTPTEQAALASRLTAAQTSANARGILAILNDFGGAVKSSRAVLARALGDLHSFVMSENRLYVSFHSQVRAGSRLPEDNQWDRGRNSAEGTIHPIYAEKINYAALSLDGLGVLGWGEYSIVLKDIHIVNRTSVFEENTFLFCERHRVIAGHPAPPGFRATWDRRHELAMAKLVSKLDRTTVPDRYPPILLAQGTSKGDADFIECHVYGALHRTSIERVIGPRPVAGPDLTIWKSVTGTLRTLGAIVEEV
jgi:hypothetical protein